MYLAPGEAIGSLYALITSRWLSIELFVWVPALQGSRKLSLDAPAEGLPGVGRLEVAFQADGVYPFDRPAKLLYQNDQLPFLHVAAIAAGILAEADKMIGSSYIHSKGWTFHMDYGFCCHTVLICMWIPVDVFPLNAQHVRLGIVWYTHWGGSPSDGSFARIS